MTRDDQVRSLLDMVRKRAESAPEDKPLDLAAWPRVHRHYTRADTCEHGEQLNAGWLEIGQAAENAQQLLDFARIPDGYPQGRGDVDWRVAEAVLRLMDAQAYLAAITDAHARETAPGGMVGDYCIECDRRWPCPTYLWANGQRDTFDRWEPADDEPRDTPAGRWCGFKRHPKACRCSVNEEQTPQSLVDNADLMEPCAYIGCMHPPATHGPVGCTVEQLDYCERRFTAQGDRLPPRMRPCGCPEWRERTRVARRLPREVLAEAAPSGDSAAPS